MPKSTKQVAALLTFHEGVTTKEVTDLLKRLSGTLNFDNFSLQEFDPDWGGVVIYQP